MMNFMRRLMYGRYGGDHLSFSLFVIYVVLYFISVLAQLPWLSWVGVVFFIWAIFRMFSRNISRRRAENMRFLGLMSPLIRWIKMRRTMHRDKEHRYFRCHNCGQRLRVPRGKGKITITCRACGVSFEETS